MTEEEAYVAAEVARIVGVIEPEVGLERAFYMVALEAMTHLGAARDADAAAALVHELAAAIDRMAAR